MATEIRSGSVGCGSTVWIAWPPKPAPHWGRCGWSHNERTSSNVSPRSVERHSAAGWLPAYTTSGSDADGASAQIASTVAPASAGKATPPVGEACQLLPRSSEKRTCGPICQCRLDISRRGVAERLSMATAGTAPITSSGPDTSHDSRSSLRANHSPLRVPIINKVLLTGTSRGDGRGRSFGTLRARSATGQGLSDGPSGERSVELTVEFTQTSRDVDTHEVCGA